MGKEINVNCSTFTMEINGKEFIAEHDMYTRYSVFDNYANRLIKKFNTMDVFSFGHEKFLENMENPQKHYIKKNKYYSQEQMNEMAIEVYNLMWGVDVKKWTEDYNEEDHIFVNKFKKPMSQMHDQFSNTMDMINTLYNAGIIDDNEQFTPNGYSMLIKAYPEAAIMVGDPLDNGVLNNYMTGILNSIKESGTSVNYDAIKLTHLINYSIQNYEQNFTDTSLFKLTQNFDTRENYFENRSNLFDFINNSVDAIDFLYIYIKNSNTEEPLSVTDILYEDDTYALTSKVGFYNTILDSFDNLDSVKITPAELDVYINEVEEYGADLSELFNERLIDNISINNATSYLKINEELFFEPVRNYIFEKTNGEDREILLKTYAEALENNDITDEDEAGVEIVIEYFKDAKYIIELTRGSSSEYEKLNSVAEIETCISDLIHLNLNDMGLLLEEEHTR